MKKLMMQRGTKAWLLLLASLFSSVTALSQGWPSQYGGVMLQGFYWDSFD